MFNIVCMKWGERYPASYVNRLASMVRRHMTHPFLLTCFTEHAEGIDSSVNILPLPEMDLDPRLPERGWRKISMFQETLGNLSGSALFLDLDVLIVGALEPFFAVPGDFRVIKDWNLKNYIGNTSVFRFEIGAQPEALEFFLQNGESVRERFRNEQAYLSWFMKERNLLQYWDENWCVSFKRHCMRPFPLGYFIEAKKPDPETKVVVFHGNPNPHDLLENWTGRMGLRSVKKTRWIEENWK
ncbi:MAG: glycosyltransferase [Planctomycetia bacterium]|nr:glycosyltransferase [Planctomycetia bacterium]